MSAITQELSEPHGSQLLQAIHVSLVARLLLSAANYQNHVPQSEVRNIAITQELSEPHGSQLLQAIHVSLVASLAARQSYPPWQPIAFYHVAKNVMSHAGFIHYIKLFIVGTYTVFVSFTSCPCTYLGYIRYSTHQVS